MHIYYILPMTPTKKLGSAMRSKILSEWFSFNFFCCAYLFMAGKWEGGGGKRLFFGLLSGKRFLLDTTNRKSGDIFIVIVHLFFISLYIHFIFILRLIVFSVSNFLSFVILISLFYFIFDFHPSIFLIW